MTTKNLSKPFKGKINGQRLPPIPVANDQTTTNATTTTNGNLSNSILKKSKPINEDNHRFPFDNGRDSYLDKRFPGYIVCFLSR